MFKIYSDEMNEKLEQMFDCNNWRFDHNGRVIERLCDLENPTVRDLELILESFSDNIGLLSANMEIQFSRIKYTLDKMKGRKINEKKRLRLLNYMEEHADELGISFDF